MTYLGTKDPILEIAKGNVAGHAIMVALGERENMGTTATGEDIWRGNELSGSPDDETMATPDPAGEQMTVISEDAQDTSAGTGVRTLRIHYLDASGDEQTEDVTMNGTTGVNTAASDIRFVNDMYSLTVGSNGVAEDHIKIYETADATHVYNMIAQGGNKSLVPHRMVPSGKTLILKGWHAEEAQNKRCAFRIRSTDMAGVLLTGVFCFKGVAYMKQSSSGELALNQIVPALSIVKVSAWPDQASSEASCGWWGVLVDD